MNPFTWRLIDTGPLQGALNMAIDESLLCSFDPKSSQPILRIYGWNPPAISLGRFQNAEDVLDQERCREESLPVVRRVSGGGAIYHADELTYSIICSPDQIPITSSVKDSFRVLTGFLIEFYRTLGLNASYALETVTDVGRLGSRTAFCFAGKESFDILIDGKKIGGNAQRRQKNTIFQHGSIPIINQAKTGLKYMRDRTPEYAHGTTSLRDCDVTGDLNILKNILIASFRNHLCVNIHASQLSTYEQQKSHQLLVDKYSADCWNLQGEAS